MLEQLPGVEWKLLFSLSRWGGVRVPSEPKLLTWADVDWEQQRLTIHSPKTERYAGHETRQIPVFPEIATLLRDAFEQAAEGEQYVLPMLQDRTGAALRKPLMAAIRRAGLEVWPRLWANMRSSRQTELEQHLPTFAVCAMLGNNERTASKHYLQLTDDHFTKALHIPVQQVSEQDCKGVQADEAKPASQPNAVGCGTPEDKRMTPTGFEPVLPG